MYIYSIYVGVYCIYILPRNWKAAVCGCGLGRFYIINAFAL